MKILVIGGMHGNEPLGINLAESLFKTPIGGVDVMLANERAIAKNVRFINTDLNRAFPGNARARGYEHKCAAYLLDVCKGYDLVLDFHNTNCPDNDCSFVGQSAAKELFDISAQLGLSRVIIANYDCINKYAPNCISIEVSLASQLMDVDIWREKLAALSQMKKVSRAAVEKFCFVYRMTLEDRDTLNLPAKNLQAFQPIPAVLAAKMGIKSLAYPIFIGDSYTPYNYGGLLHKIE